MMNHARVRGCLLLPLLLSVAESSATAKPLNYAVSPEEFPANKAPMSMFAEEYLPDSFGQYSTGMSLKLPPARNGHVPVVRLAYSSSTATTPLGVGWSLPVPHVRRSLRYGTPRYKGPDGTPYRPPSSERAPYEDTFEYTLDGSSGELIYVGTHRHGEYLVYRPYPVRSFAVFYYKKRKDIWIVQETDGVTWYLGEGEARETNPNCSKPHCNPTYSWHVNRCEDAPAFAGQKIYDCPGYRLPTEAEWEYAYRAGTTTALYNGPLTTCKGKDPNADQIAWYGGNAKIGVDLHPGGQKMANGFGLHDMAGNAWEWTHDMCELLDGDPAVDPVEGTGPPAHSRLLKDRLLFAEAQRRKLDQDPAVRRRFRAMVNGRLLQQVHDKARARAVTDAESQRYHDEHVEAFTSPPVTRFSRVVVTTRAAADELVAALGKTERTSRLVRDLVEKHTIEKGSGGPVGDMGYLRRNHPRVPVALHGAMAQLEGIGDHTVPTEIDGRWVVFVKTAGRSRIKRSLKQVKAHIRLRILAERRKQGVKALIDALRGGAEIREGVLARVAAPADGKGGKP